MPLTDQLVAYWRLDEAAGDATDVLGGNPLTDSGGVSSAAGVVNGARTFNGASQSLTHASDADLSLGDEDWTIAAWVYLAAKPTVAIAVGKYAGNITAYYALYYYGIADRLVLDAGSIAGAHAAIANSFGAPALNTWYHVVAWNDHAAGQIGIAINAGAADTVAHTGGSGANAGNFALGDYGGALSSYWNGRLDEVGIWRRVLTSAERTTLYNGGAGLSHPFTTGPILTADAGAFVLAGGAATLTAAATIAAATGVYLVAGGAADLLAGQLLQAMGGAFVLAGGAATLTVQPILTADAGAFVLAGGAATLTAAATIAAATGVYLVAGGAADLLAGQLLTAAGGAFVLAGGAATLTAAATIAAATGVYLVAGGAADLLAGQLLTAAGGAFVLAGGAATLSARATLTAFGGAFALAGGASTGQANPVIMTAATGVYLVAGGTASLWDSADDGGGGGVPPAGSGGGPQHLRRSPFSEEGETVDTVLVDNDRLEIGVGADAVAATLNLCEIALVKEDIPIDRATTYAALEAAKATFTGNAPKVVTWSAATRADDGRIEYLGTAAEFRPTDAVTPNGIYGLYVRNAAHSDVLFAARFVGAPIPMESVLDSMRITLRYRPRGPSLAALIS